MLAFKSTPTISEEDEDEKDDEDLFLLVKNVKRMYNKANSTTEENGKAKRTRRLFATIVKKSNMSLSNAWRTKPSPQHSRNHIRRKF